MKMVGNKERETSENGRIEETKIGKTETIKRKPIK
jgi:hypothetical protein